MNEVAIALGASLGDRARTLVLATHALAHLGVGSAPSRIIATPPVGGVASAGFYNAVVRLRTSLEPQALHASLRDLERRLGRRPTRRWADRVLDLDLLLYGGAVLDTPDLIVPHPRIRERPFVLQPLREVWPGARDPVRGDLYAAIDAGAPHPVVGVLPRLRGVGARCTPAASRSSLEDLPRHREPRRDP